MALQKLNAQTLEGDLDVVDITASGDITLTSTASFKIPSGTTQERGTSTTGALRFNSTTSEFEGYNGSEWGTIGGGGLTDADEDTYITAEATADSDDLDFWTAGTKRMTIDQTGLITVGVDDTGYDVKFFGATSGSFMLWNETDDALELTDASPIRIGDDAVGDMTLYHDGTDSYITNKTGALKLATETSGIVVTIGHTTSETTIADNLTVTGDLTVSGTTTTIDSTTINVQTAFVFEGATADDYETTLAVTDPTADRTITLPDADGTLVHVSSPTASIKVPTGTTLQRGTATQGGFRFNTETPGFEGYDGSAWGAISGAENAYTKQTFTSTVNQTIFTLANAYTLGYIEVYLNGVKLISGDDFTATDTSTPYRVILASGVAAGNVVQTVAFNTFVVAEDTLTTQTFTATANQTTFTLNDAYTVGFINVYLNGIKLVVGVDVTASNGTTVVLIAGADVGDTLQTEAFGTFSSSNTVPSTGGTFSGNITIPTGTASGHAVTKAQLDASGIDGISSTGSSLTDTVTVAGNLAVSGATLTLAGMTSNLATFTSDLTVAANYSMAVIGPVTIPNVTINGNLNVMTELNVTGDIDTGANGSFNIIG